MKTSKLVSRLVSLSASMMFLGLSVMAFAAPSSGPTSSVVVNGHEILTNRNQLTAYVFDNDKNGVSSCYNGCAGAWPAILVQSGDEIAAPFGTTTRKDGTLQVTYQGRPIYLYADDQKPGDIEGDGLGGVWHIVDLN